MWGKQFLMNLGIQLGFLQGKIMSESLSLLSAHRRTLNRNNFRRKNGLLQTIWLQRAGPIKLGKGMTASRAKSVLMIFDVCRYFSLSLKWKLINCFPTLFTQNFRGCVFKGTVHVFCFSARKMKLCVTLTLEKISQPKQKRPWIHCSMHHYIHTASMTTEVPYNHLNFKQKKEVRLH